MSYNPGRVRDSSDSCSEWKSEPNHAKTDVLSSTPSLRVDLPCKLSEMERERHLPRLSLKVLGTRMSSDPNLMRMYSRTNACMINGGFLEESQGADHSALGQLVGQRAEFVRCNGRLGI